MPKYEVDVTLSAYYDEIEADSEEEAFLIASQYAMRNGDWKYCVSEVDDE